MKTFGQRMRWAPRVIAVLFGCFLALGVAEVYLRVTARGWTVDRWAVPHPKYGFVNRPNFFQTVVRPWGETTYVWHVAINSLGFRGAEPNLDDHEALRILLLGDSFTFGYGVEYERTFAAVLEKKLREAGIRSIIFNSGVTGWGTAQQLLFASDHLEQLRPDIVVLTFCENDPIEDEVFAHGGADGILPMFPGKRWVRDHVRLYSTVYNAVSSLLYRRYVLRQPKATAKAKVATPPVAATNHTALQRPSSTNLWYYRTMDNLRNFVTHWKTAEHASRCPMMFVQNVEFWRNDLRDMMRVLEAEGYIRFVDLRDDVGHLPPEETKLPFDPHWNPNMHVISGERLAREILLWLSTNRTASAVQ